MKKNGRAGGSLSTKATYHHGNLRNALMEEALRQIALVGAHSLSLRVVARNVGVSHTASYRHFGSKEDMLAAIAERGFVMLGDALSAAMEKHKGDPLEAFEASGVAYVEFGVGHPEHLQVMFGGMLAGYEQWPSLQKARDGAAGLLKFGVHMAVESGQIRGEEDTIALAAWSMGHGLTQLIVSKQLKRGKESARQLAMAVGSMLRKGLECGRVPSREYLRTGKPLDRTHGKTKS